MTDADFEFVKVKNLLSKTPKMLREDPILQIDYMKILNLIKKKKLLENTADQFDPTATVHTNYFDVEQMETEQLKREQRQREEFAKKYNQEMML